MFATKPMMTGIAVFTLALLVSCGKNADNPATALPTADVAPVAQPAPPPGAPASEAAALAPDGAALASDAAAPAPTAPAAVPAPSAPVLATSDGETAGLSVEVTELKRGSGGTLTLKFAMVNNTKEEVYLRSAYGAGGGNVDDNTVSGTHLIDAVNKKKYLVVRDSENQCVCSRVNSAIPVGARMNLWAKFPAPPEDVKVISVMILHFAPMDDVPISP